VGYLDENGLVYIWKQLRDYVDGKLESEVTTQLDAIKEDVSDEVKNYINNEITPTLAENLTDDIINIINNDLLQFEPSNSSEAPVNN